MCIVSKSGRACSLRSNVFGGDNVTVDVKLVVVLQFSTHAWNCQSHILLSVNHLPPTHYVRITQCVCGKGKPPPATHIVLAEQLIIIRVDLFLDEA